VPTKYCFSLYFPKNITCFSVCPLRICPVPSVCCQTVYRWVRTYCSLMRGISESATCFGPMWAIIRKNHSYKRRIWHWYLSSCVSTNSCFSLLFRKNITCLNVGLLRAVQVLLFAVQLCIGGLRHIAALWEVYRSLLHVSALCGRSSRRTIVTRDEYHIEMCPCVCPQTIASPYFVKT